MLWDAIQVITAFTVLGNFAVGLSSLLSRNVQLLVWDVCPSFIIGMVSKQACTNVRLVPFSHKPTNLGLSQLRNRGSTGLRSHETLFICSLVTSLINGVFKRVFDALFPTFVCAQLWWHQQRLLHHRRYIARRMAYRRWISELTLTHDAE